MKMVIDDLRLIKKYYGENMMHLCRTLFPTLLETPGLLFKTLSNAFAYSPFLYDDIIREKKEEYFAQYIYSFVEIEENYSKSEKSVKELFESVGYDLYECHTEEDIQSFKKYYAPKEELCTFNGGRLNSSYVFFAVKKNVDEIKRENFDKPDREDEYSTSVMSIQFTKGSVNRVSIKSRYNHAVNNPDALYKNNLDRICPGLTDAFNREYPNIVIRVSNNSYEDFFPGYVKGNDNKLYKYYYKHDNVYFCPDNYIIDNGVVKHYDKNTYLVFGTYILNIADKTITEYDKEYKDGFIKALGQIDKLLIRTTKDGRKFIYVNYNILIVLNPFGDIIEYHDNISTEIEDYFLYKSKALEVVSLPKAINIDDYFLTFCNKLRELYIPEVRSIGGACLEYNSLKTLELPKVECVGEFFLSDAISLETISAPKLEEIESGFLEHNKVMKEIYLPMAEMIADDFMKDNCIIERVDLPMVKTIGCNFIELGKKVSYLNLPNVEEIDDDFLTENEVLEEISLPKVKRINCDFLYSNEILSKVYMPLLEYVNENFLYSNNSLTRVYFPNLTWISSYFMASNNCAIVVNIPNVEEIRHGFFINNRVLRSLYLPRVKKIGDGFFGENREMYYLGLPSLIQVGSGFLENNLSLKVLSLDNLRRIGISFLMNNNSLEVIDFPNAINIGSDFMRNNNSLKRICLGKVTRVGNNFLEYNNSLEFAYFPYLAECGLCFLNRNNTLTAIDLPNLIYAMHGFLDHNRVLEIINIPRKNCDIHGLNNNDKYKRTALTGKEADELFLVHYMKKSLISYKKELEKRAGELSTEHPDEYKLLKAA